MLVAFLEAVSEVNFMSNAVLDGDKRIRVGLLAVLLGVMLTLSACGQDEQRAHNVSTNPAVEAQAKALFEAIESGDEQRIVKQYDEKFFANRSPQEWLAKLKTLMAERGPMTAYHLRRSQADTRFSGKFYILEYNTVHSGRKRLHHVVTLLLPVEGGAMQLIGHKITPWEAEPEKAQSDKTGQGKTASDTNPN
jgi:hypothetical protein